MEPTVMLLITTMTLTVTSYRSIPEQTDASPNWTSLGHHVHPNGVAASRDLIKSGAICYGDVVQIPGFGLKVVNDTMHPRLKNHLDIWVSSHKEEKRIGTRKNQYITVIKSEKRICK